MKRKFEGLPVLYSKKQRKDVPKLAKPIYRYHRRALTTLAASALPVLRPNPRPPATHRLDVGLFISPEALVGRQLRVQWDDGKKYVGVVEAFHPATQQHTVEAAAAAVHSTRICSSF